MEVIVIKSVRTVDKDENNYVSVTAVVEDAVLLYGQTYLDPPEYAPGLCEASFVLSDDEDLPKDDLELIEFLEELDLDWELCDSDY